MDELRQQHPGENGLLSSSEMAPQRPHTLGISIGSM